MGPDGVGLKHHAELALLRRDPSGRAIRRNDFAVDAHLAAVGNFQPGDAAQQCGFSRTAGTDDDEQLALGDFQVERLDRGDHAVADGEPFVQAADGNHRIVVCAISELGSGLAQDGSVWFWVSSSGFRVEPETQNPKRNFQ